jgi:RNA polymerase sigma-70 factor (ECF subfamily)
MTPGRGASPPLDRSRGSSWIGRAVLVLASDLGLEPKPAGSEDRRSEATLIKAAQGGSEEALEVLFRRHWRGAHRAAYLIVRDPQAAEDIAQEGFLAAIRALDRFDRRRPFRPWLHRIVVNRAIDHTRARALRREVSAGAVLDGMPAADPPSGFELGPALAALSPEHRAVIVLRYLLDYTPGEIARMLGLRRGTVNSRLRRGLDQLAEALGEQGR